MGYNLGLEEEEDVDVTRSNQEGMVVVVNSFLFVLGTNGRMQPVVMAPNQEGIIGLEGMVWWGRELRWLQGQGVLYTLR